MGLRKAAATVGTTLLLTTSVIQAETAELLATFKDKVQAKVEETTPAQDNTRVNTSIAEALQVQFTPPTKPKNFDILGGDPGNLKIDRTTYKISCDNCKPNSELNATLNLLNNTPITDVNRKTVVVMFMWIEDNLPEEEQLNNKLAVLNYYGVDEGTMEVDGGTELFRYNPNNISPKVEDVIDWFKGQNASPLDFITRLFNDYQDNTTKQVDEIDDLGLGDLDLGDTELSEQAKKRLEESLTQGREKLIKAARAYVATGGNPADLPGWEEASKKYNITPDDL